MRKVLKTIFLPVFRKLLKWSFYKPRQYSYMGLTAIVNPKVFAPQFFISTRILLDMLNEMDLMGKKVLELGSGAGIISMLAASKGALVTASDISPLAVINTLENANKLGFDIAVYESDVFSSIPKQVFDLIVVNPPYYPKDPKTEHEYAWYCGEGFEYFERFFQSAGPYLSKKGEIRMILSEDCDASRILNIAKQAGLELNEILKYNKMGERNFVYIMG